MCAGERGDMESSGEEAGRSAPPVPHTPAAPQPNGSNKIIGRNVNGTSKSPHEIFIGLLKSFIYIVAPAACLINYNHILQVL